METGWWVHPGLSLEKPLTFLESLLPPLSGAPSFMELLLQPFRAQPDRICSWEKRHRNTLTLAEDGIKRSWVASLVLFYKISDQIGLDAFRKPRSANLPGFKSAVCSYTSLSTECSKWDLGTVRLLSKTGTAIICAHFHLCVFVCVCVCTCVFTLEKENGLRGMNMPVGFWKPPVWSECCQSAAFCSSTSLNAYWIQIIFMSSSKFSAGRSALFNFF